MSETTGRFDVNLKCISKKYCVCLFAVLLSLSCSGEERGTDCCENDNDLPFRVERLQFHGKMNVSYLFTINMLLRIGLFFVL